MKSHGATLIGGSFWTPKITKISGDSKPRAIHDTNFETTQSIPPSMQFSRLSAATYFKNNVLTDAVIDEARFESAGLLVEKQSTNLFNYSNNWQTGQLTLLGNATVGGGVVSLTAPSSSTARTATPIDILATQSTYSTVIASKLGGDAPNMLTTQSSSDATIIIANSLVLPANYKSKLISGGKYLISGGLTPRAYSGLNFGVWTYATNRPATVSIDFIQVENSLTYPSSLIKTNGSPTTRSADVLTIKATNQSILIKYKRQDTDAIEKQIVDAVSDHMLNLTVGCHLQRVKVFNRILTAEEKVQELANV